MPRNVNELKEFLREIGTPNVSHSNDDFFTHLIGVYNYLNHRRYPEHITHAGLFHSIYSTDEFDGFSLALTKRGEIRNLIGAQAERLVYLYCFVAHESLFKSIERNDKNLLENRFDNQPLALTEQEYEELLLLVWVNYFEIEARVNENLSKPAALLRKGRNKITKLLVNAGLIRDAHFQLKTMIERKINNFPVARPKTT